MHKVMKVLSGPNFERDLNSLNDYLFKGYKVIDSVPINGTRGLANGVLYTIELKTRGNA